MQPQGSLTLADSSRGRTVTAERLAEPKPARPTLNGPSDSNASPEAVPQPSTPPGRVGQPQGGAAAAAPGGSAAVIGGPRSSEAGQPPRREQRHVEVQKVESNFVATATHKDGAPRGAVLDAQGIAQQPPARTPGPGQEGGHRDWLTQLVDGLFPYYRDAFQALAWDTVPEELEASRPSWVYEMQMDRFTLGDRQPVLSNISVSRDDTGGVDELFVEFDAEWHSEQDVVIRVVVPRLPLWLASLTPDVLENAMRAVMHLDIALRDLWVRAGVRVTLRPLERRLPVIGAMQLGLTRPPQFGYELSLGMAEAALVPLLKEWLDGTIKESVLQPFVLPDHYFYPLDPGAPDVDKPAGVLLLSQLVAEHVPRRGLPLRRHAQPLLEAYVRDSQRRKTRVAPPGEKARWDQELGFPIGVPEHQELTVVLWDYDEWAPNDELGRATLPVRQLQPGVQQQLQLELKPRSEQKHDDEKRKRGGLERVAMALGRPLTRRSPRPCRLTALVTWLPLAPPQLAVLMAAKQHQQRQGGPQQRPQQQQGQEGQQGLVEALASPAGRALPPEVRSLALGALLSVGVRRIEGQALGSSWMRPFCRLEVRVGEEECSDAVRASRNGALEFPRALTLALPPHLVLREEAKVELEVYEHTWIGSTSRLARLELPLQPLRRGQAVSGTRRMESGGMGWPEAQLEVRLHPYF